MVSASKIAWDTNMLLNIERFNIDVFYEAKKMFGKVEFIVPRQVINELEGLSKEGNKLKKEVNIARELMEKNKVQIIEIEARNADEALTKMSSEAIIATNDKELKDKVRELNGKVLYLRQKKMLELI